MRHRGRLLGQLRRVQRNDDGGGQAAASSRGSSARASASRRSTTSSATGSSRRQRYWGEPIPLVHCEDVRRSCPSPRVRAAPSPARDEELTRPPARASRPWRTSPSGSTLRCPKCGGPAKRETNTMPQWAGSCWYYLRYLDPRNADAFASKEAERVLDARRPLRRRGRARGAPPPVLALLAQGPLRRRRVSTKEPFMRLINQGMILGEDNQKMSKSRATSSTPTTSCGNSAPTRCASTRCSWGRSRCPSPGPPRA